MFRGRTVSAILPAVFVLAAAHLMGSAASSQDATPTDATPTDGAAHAREVEEWRADRDQRLREPDGWFSLVGLSWLSEGANPAGSAKESAVPMPANAPAELGVFHLAERKVQFATAPGAEVTHDGAPVKWMALESDAQGEATVLEAGSLLFYVIERGERFGVRIKDRESPALLAFEGIENYPVQKEWRITGRLEPHDPPKEIAVPNVLGTVTESPSPGAVVFRIAGRTHRLDALPGSADELFMVFGDATNGETTYGGGRFLYAELLADGQVVLDFNKAYNPPCAFTPYATCPLPPKQNRLALRIEAGEKNYGHH